MIKALTISALALTLFGGSPASAQFEITFPDRPKGDDETLLEWADPPILKHSIPQEQRGDTSSCGATSEYDLNQTAVTCWPVLRAAQLHLLADYAAQEPTGDKTQNLARAIAHADEAIAFIGTPEWPLQEYLLIKSFEVKLNALTKLEEWEASYDASLQLVSVLQNDLFQYDEFRLSFANRKRGEVFLKLGLYEAAKLHLEEARDLLTGFDGDKNAMAFSDQSEDVIIAAIRRGDRDYARQTAKVYLDHIVKAPRGLRFGFDSHIDLSLYLTAIRGDQTSALGLLELRFKEQRDYARCHKGMFEFPRVLGNLVEHEAIANALIEGGCEPEQLATRPGEPIKGLHEEALPALGLEGALVDGQ